MSVEVKIDERDFNDANRILESIDKTMRGEAVEASLNAAAELVVARAKQEVPQPGYPGDKPGLKPLRDTITHVIRTYSGTKVAVVGAQYPAGAHAHLVHEGHVTSSGTRTRKNPFLERAADGTRSQQIAAILGTLKKFAE